MKYMVYILQSITTGGYYIGHTGDLLQRICRHNSNRVRATKNRGPWRAVYKEKFETRSEAVLREESIKHRKDRGYIEKLIAG